MKNLINSTAIEGLMKNYNLSFGKTFSQAFQCLKWYLSIKNDANLHKMSNEYDEVLLKTVINLKGVHYKGIPKPAVIRRQKLDFVKCQNDLKTKEAEEVKLCETSEQKDFIEKLNNFFPLIGNDSVKLQNTSMFCRLNINFLF